MRRNIVIASVVVAAVVAGGIGAATAGEDQEEPAKDPRCPRHALPLPADALGPATRAALLHVRQRGDDPRGARAVSAAVATHAVGGGRIRQDCDRELQHRTVIVDLLYPARVPSATVSRGSVAVSLTPSGYRVWALLD